jgi:hypothetical protein
VARRDLKGFQTNGHAPAARGITPLEVMLEAMRAAHARGDLAAAAAFAKAMREAHARGDHATSATVPARTRRQRRFSSPRGEGVAG